MHSPAVIALALLLAACAPGGKAPGVDARSAASRVVQEDAIREAAFRHQLQTGTVDPAKPLAHCLQVDGRDPSDALLARFPRLYKASDCDQRRQGVRVVASGQPALLLRSGAIRWRNDAEVEIAVGFYFAGQGASEHTYRLQRVEGRWRVLSETLDIVA